MEFVTELLIKEEGFVSWDQKGLSTTKIYHAYGFPSGTTANAEESGEIGISI